MRGRGRAVLVLGLLGAGVAAPIRAQQGGAALPAGFDAFVDSVRRAFDVPGIAVAVVRDGRVLLARGYGTTRVQGGTPVTGRTRFAIASNTKLVTATALAMLVDERRLAWDDPVVQHLPWFQMHDPWVTRELTVRDLLVHRSGLGLGAGDLLWWPPSTYDRAEIARRLRHLRPVTSFRSAYAYDNVLYLVAGLVVEAVSGQSWEQFVEARVLRPVGMTASAPRVVLPDAEPDVAAPHAEVEGRVRPVASFASDNTNPAGGIMSTAADLARWMIVQLDSGRVSGTRLWSARQARELWTPVTPTPAAAAAPEGFAHLRPQFSGYALGLNVRDWRGHKLLTHTGGLPGYVSRVAMVPDRRLGVAVLTNQEAGGAFNAIAWRLIDHLLGAPPADYLGLFRRLAAEQAAEAARVEREARAARDSLSRPSLPLARYAAAYRDAWYGDVEVAHEQGRLVMRFTRTPLLVGDLDHWQHDTFLVRWRDRELRADAYVTFQLDAAGRVARATMVPASPLVDFSFDFQDLDLVPAR